MKSTAMHMRHLLLKPLAVLALFFTFNCSLFTPQAHATSQDTTRNLLINGIVLTGATPSINAAEWETDEELSGFSGAVNWYITWDSTNLYLGRIGGNNNEGSILYVHADYPGATFADTAFSYDQLNPHVTPMGGVNFAAYLKSSYHEFRTYNTAWSGPTSTLSPQFTTQTNGDNMEVAIPWNAITAGNGRPTSIRLSLYQVAQPGGCTTHLVYGESPWGTGNPGDGPSAAVNDGTPTSPRMPGGCDVGDSTATRWWGCYPVMGSVGTNNWRFADSTLTQDTIACADTAAHPLVAMSTNGAGIWTLLSAPGGAPPVTITNPSAAITTATNLTAAGTYTFLFTGTGTACYTSYDTVRYRVTTPTPITLGPDTTICETHTICLIPSPLQAINTITWSTGSTADTICTTTGGTYSFTAVDTQGCASADTILISIDSLPAVQAVIIDSSQCPDITFTVLVTGGPTSTHFWDLGNGVQLNGATISYNYQSWGNGIYPFSVFIQDGCWSDTYTDSLTINCITGIADKQPSAITVSPNPSTGCFQVTSPAADLIAIKVHTLSGQLVHEIRFPAAPVMVTNMDLSTLAEGQYFLGVETAQGVTHRRINIMR